jgi:predicted solute-binding protein
VGNVTKIATEWRTRLGMAEDEITQYLRHNIEYKLAPDCLEGLKLFYRYAEQVGALPHAPELRFLP